ncbi:nuclear transport factor 2 family protein [Mycobacterium sp. MBM]|nr:nuclear transport factor 2 family protein [Mycobacterium sp. MBM]
MSITEDDRLEAMLAREEIRSLPIRYAAAVEARDVDAMAELFAPHARFGSYGQGPDGLRRLMTDSLTGSLFAVILVANHLIDLHDGTHGSGQVWAHCYAHTRADGFVEQLIRYEDQYERCDGRWLFAHRRHRLWFGTSHTRSPLAQPAADWPASQVGVGDIPLADPQFVAWWRSVR